MSGLKASSLLTVDHVFIGTLCVDINDQVVIRIPNEDIKDQLKDKIMNGDLESVSLVLNHRENKIIRPLRTKRSMS